MDYQFTNEIKAQICFCTKNKLSQYKSAIREKSNGEDVIVYGISCVVLAKKDIGPDWTYGFTKQIEANSKKELIQALIQDHGIISCFENIPRHELIQIENEI